MEVGFQHLSGCLVLSDTKKLTDVANIVLRKDKLEIIYHYDKLVSLIPKHQRTSCFSIKKDGETIFEGDALIEDVQLISMGKKDDRSDKVLMERLIIIPLQV